MTSVRMMTGVSWRRLRRTSREERSHEVKQLVGALIVSHVNSIVETRESFFPVASRNR
jgi:hypothetical protein